METALRTVNALISALLFICYAYQFLYIPLVLAKKQRPLPCPPSPHRYAVLIAARNESAVIGGLLDSLRQQTYDPALLTVFVAADNCTDDTAAIGTVGGLRKELEKLNQLAWQADEDTILGWADTEGYPVDGTVDSDGQYSKADIPEHTQYDTQSLAKFAFSMFWRAMRFAEEQQVPILLDY